jgi:hypothetical protein
MKTCEGMEVWIHHSSPQLHAPTALPIFYRRLDGPQSRPGRYGENEKSLAPAGNRNPVFQPVTIPTELFRLIRRRQKLLFNVASEGKKIVYLLFCLVSLPLSSVLTDDISTSYCGIVLVTAQKGC